MRISACSTPRTSLLTVAARVLAVAAALAIPVRAVALDDPPSPAPAATVAATPDDPQAKKAGEGQEAGKAKSDDEKIPRVTEGVTVTAKAPPRKTEISPDVRTLPAAATVLERATIETRPYRETAEILRAAPGMDFVYYGQGGAPSGTAFRGYTDRNFGQDLAGFIDGVPLNVFGAVASHGMMDVTSLLPESIDHIDLIRGPFDIRYGDFHRGGSVNFVTREGAAHPSVSVSGGSYGDLRGLASYGNYDPDQRKVSVYANVDVKNSDGYADNQTVEYVRTYDKILIPLGENSDLSVAGLYFDSKWDAPSYLDRDLVRAGALDDQTAVNPTDGGDMQHGLLYTRLRVGATNPLTATLYGASRDWTRFRSDFLISPTTTQVRQIDDRWIWGYRVEKSLGFSLAGNPGVFLVGTTLQRDDAKTIQDRTLLRRVIGNTDNVDELLTQAAGYAQAQWMARSWLKLAGGVRYDHVNYKLHDNIRAAGTYVSDYDAGRWSPKVGIAVSPFSGFEIYGNYATGMRSPTPRSEVRNSLSSVSRVEIAKTESYEAGVTARVLERLHILTGVWQTDNSNEIRGIPPGGVEFESLGKSRRKGVDLELNWYPWSATRVFGSLSFVNVKLTTPTTPAATHLPDIPKYVHQVGAETHFEPWAGFGGFTVAADWSFYGPKDLNTTATIRAEKYQRATARVIWAGPKAYRIWLGGVYYPASTIAEAAFLFGSKVGVRASPRFSLQGGVGYTFE